MYIYNIYIYIYIYIIYIIYIYIIYIYRFLKSWQTPKAMVLLSHGEKNDDWMITGVSP